MLTFTDLSAPVDVFYEWLDACNQVAKEAATSTTRSSHNNIRQPTDARNRLEAGEEQGEEGYADDGDGFVENDEVDGEAAYGDE